MAIVEILHYLRDIGLGQMNPTFTTVAADDLTGIPYGINMLNTAFHSCPAAATNEVLFKFQGYIGASLISIVCLF
jgi:hypothetical protein